MPALHETPSANRLHIAIYGRRNAGKSSLINALTGQQAALVSDIPGTTTDPVKKAMEVRGLGACMLIDTAGFDDEGELGALRVQKTCETIPKTDIALLVCSEEDLTLERIWSAKLKDAGVKQIAVISKADIQDPAPLAEAVAHELGMQPIIVSAKTQTGIPELLTALARAVPESHGSHPILGGLAKPGDTVLLVCRKTVPPPKVVSSFHRCKPSANCSIPDVFPSMQPLKLWMLHFQHSIRPLHSSLPIPKFFGKSMKKRQSRVNSPHFLCCLLRTKVILPLLSKVHAP